MLTNDFTKPEKGLFIAVDGPDGCGKTSIVKTIRNFLDARGISNEPMIAIGQGDFGKKCRDYVVHNSQEILPEAMIFGAAHLVCYNDEIIPRLNTGRTVVMDRWISSMYAYQVYGRQSKAAGKIYDTIFSENEKFNRWPDLYLICNVSPAVSELRLRNRGVEFNNHFDNERMEFKKRVQNGFDNFKMRYFNRIQTIDCDFNEDHVKKIVEKHLTDLLISKSIKPIQE